MESFSVRIRKHYFCAWTIVKMVLKHWWIINTHMNSTVIGCTAIAMQPLMGYLVLSCKAQWLYIMLWKGCIWVWTLIKAVKNDTELNMHESKADVWISTRFSVILCEMQKLQKCPLKWFEKAMGPRMVLGRPWDVTCSSFDVSATLVNSKGWGSQDFWKEGYIGVSCMHARLGGFGGMLPEDFF